MTKTTETEIEPTTAPEALAQGELQIQAAETAAVAEANAEIAASTKTPIETIIARIDAHEAEGAAIDADMTGLGLDKKGVKQIRKANEQLAAAQKTRDALLGLAKAQ